MFSALTLGVLLPALLGGDALEHWHAHGHEERGSHAQEAGSNVYAHVAAASRAGTAGGDAHVQSGGAVGQKGAHVHASSVGTSRTISLRREVQLVGGAARGGSKIVHKTAYYGPLEMGSGKQKFTVEFDTGSGNLVIPLSSCESHACQAHKRFRAKASTTAKDINADGTPAQIGATRDEITIQFGTGQVTGFALQDNACIGSLCTKARFIGATEETDEMFSAFKFDGILGLARLPMSHSPEFNVMNSLASSGALRSPMFSVFLSDSDSEDSEVTFGDVKLERMAGDMVWAPVSRDSGYWQVQMDDITINGFQTTLCPGCHAAVDTGTNQIAGPSEVVAELSKRLNVLHTCENYDRLKDLGFSVGGHVLNLKPVDYVDKGPDGCSVSLMPLDVPPPNGPLFVLGDPFLRKYYTAYDWGGNRVGFAAARHAGAPEGVALITALRGTVGVRH